MAGNESNRASRRRVKHLQLTPGFTPIGKKGVVYMKIERKNKATVPLRELRRKRSIVVNPELTAESLIHGVI
jgi:hypothetical protein